MDLKLLIFSSLTSRKIFQILFCVTITSLSNILVICHVVIVVSNKSALLVNISTIINKHKLYVGEIQFNKYQLIACCYCVPCSGIYEYRMSWIFLFPQVDLISVLKEGMNKYVIMLACFIFYSSVNISRHLQIIPYVMFN